MPRIAILAFGLILGVYSATLVEQQWKKVYWLGILTPEPRASSATQRFVRDLGGLGYIEGQNLVIELRFGEGRAERFPELAAQLAALKPDAIVTFGTNGAVAAKQATATIPVVFMLVSDPVASGLVASLRHPGGNFTGLTDYGVDLPAKFVELVRAVLPKATRIGVLMSDNPIHPVQLSAIEEAAKGFGLGVVAAMDRSNEELDPAFAALAKENASAVIALGGVTQATQRERIAELAAKAGMATLFPNRAYVDKGGLMSYGPNLPASYKLLARYVDRILKGETPADIPVEQPPEFELVINLKTAKALSITIPQSLLLRADEVIQ
jgi:putative ABC transport system substrate-binding protein